MKKVPLWKGSQLSGKFALVDDKDYDLVVEAAKSYGPDGTLRKGTGKWRLFAPTSNLKYAITYSGKALRESGLKSQFIHRIIMGNPKGKHIDHINGDGLDNRKANLRICSVSQNCMNKKLRSDSTTGYKGVYRLKPTVHRKKYISKKTGKTTYYTSVQGHKNKPYKAMIGLPGTSGKKKSIGYYTTARKAALAYNEWAIKLYGEFAYLNGIKEEK